MRLYLLFYAGGRFVLHQIIKFTTGTNNNFSATTSNIKDNNYCCSTPYSIPFTAATHSDLLVFLSLSLCCNSTLFVLITKVDFLLMEIPIFLPVGKLFEIYFNKENIQGNYL